MPLNLEAVDEVKPFTPTTPEQFSQEYRNKLGRLLELTEKQENKIKKVLKKEIDAWKSDTSELQRRLEDWNDLVEGIVEDTTFPWIGASNIHIPVVGIYMKTFHSLQRRSILGTEKIWFADVDPLAAEESNAFVDRIPDIDDAMNYKARSEWNIQDAISEVLWTTNRDGLGILQIPYVEEYEHTKDFVLVGNIHEFLVEFPDPQSAGIDFELYEQWGQAADEATEANPVEIPIEYDRLIYRGPKGEVVELADYVTFPATARGIARSECRGYGKRFSMRKGIIRDKGREGFWYEDKVKEFLKSLQSGNQPTRYHISKDRAEGLTRTGKLDEHELYEMVLYIQLERGAGEAKILVTYSKDKDILLSAIEYPYRVDFYALFRIEKRPNRQIGPGVPSQLQDINLEVNAQHNQRINSRTIAGVPSFKARQSAGYLRDFLESEEGISRPGQVYWLEKMDDFEQMPMNSPDLGQSLQEEDNDIKTASLYMGTDVNLASGLPASDDPKAPGNKTALLIQQGNLRQDDPLQELRIGVQQVGDICLSHLYQFGPPLITFFKEGPAGTREKRTIPKRLLRRGFKMKMHGQTVTLNPDSELQKWLAYYGAFTKEPVIAQSVKRRIEILRRALQAGRVPGRDKILPSFEELQEEELEMRVAVEKKIRAEKQAAQEKAAQDQRQQQRKQLRESISDQRLRQQLRGDSADRTQQGIERAANQAAISTGELPGDQQNGNNQAQ